MAKKVTTRATGGDKPKRKKSVARAKSSSGSRKRSSGGMDAGEAFVKLLQSPLAAELVAVAATAALATLAEQGFTSRGGEGSTGKRTGRAVKAAGKAAAAAVGRRLSTEIDEIRKAAKVSKGAKACAKG
jgi:hypothetical protein